MKTSFTCHTATVALAIFLFHKFCCHIFSYSIPFFFILLSRHQWYPIAFKLLRVWGFFLFILRNSFFKVKYLANWTGGLGVICSISLSLILMWLLTYVVHPILLSIRWAKPNCWKYLCSISSLKGEYTCEIVRAKLIRTGAFVRAGQECRAKELEINLFPEGTITHHAPVMGRF